MRALATVFLVLAVPAVVCSSAGAGHARAGGRAVQRLLALDHRIAVRAAPNPRSRTVGFVAQTTPLTESQTVLPIVGRATGPTGGHWLRVRLPTRPNDATGWVPAYVGRVSTTPWQIVVHRSSRRALVLEHGRLRASFPVVVGKPSTPTPLGSFFVIEKLHLSSGVTEGPWALATSAHSDVLTDFAGGNGQVALHGTVGLSDPLGTASSHGCVRFSPAAITWIATHVVDGTIVLIQP